ncbi:hypothetical protein [Roseobacter fucihabitans]|uniref:hypothetical protein n=1 Tax=Roseobacter fucihabitans TaxID=1537242 RepID=UPI001CA33E45|nr:hypothetical protein [Roseobacter litoralis]
MSEAMESYAKAFIRSDGSLRKLAHIGSRKLVELCQSEGSDIAAPVLSQLCKLNAKWTSRFTAFKRVARKDRDAKLHFDKDQPRIARHGSALPGQVVFGDVHPVDIWVLKEGTREQVRVRLIAWHDDCTHMMHVTPVLFLKGRGVRQSDIIDSFYDLSCDPQFGLPGTLYLDNGGEYGSLFGSFQSFPDLSMIVPERGVIKAKPYNGPAKGLIEGAFGSIERQFIKHLPGYIGGDRTNKKTQSVGKPPAPYSGTYGDLLTQLEEVAAVCRVFRPDRPWRARSRMDGKPAAWMIRPLISCSANRPVQWCHKVLFSAWASGSILIRSPSWAMANGWKSGFHCAAPPRVWRLSATATCWAMLIRAVAKALRAPRATCANTAPAGPPRSTAIRSCMRSSTRVSKRRLSRRWKRRSQRSSRPNAASARTPFTSDGKSNPAPPNPILNSPWSPRVLQIKRYHSRLIGNTTEAGALPQLTNQVQTNGIKHFAFNLRHIRQL